MFKEPRQGRFKKTRKGKLRKLEFKSNDLKFGTLGLKSVESGFISSQQIEAARQAIIRKIKRKGKIWIRVWPDLPVTLKSAGARMGKGKGRISHWCVRVCGGAVLFELCGISLTAAVIALKIGGAKLPIKTKVFS
jgi:large subunit ribosomal protein L16